MNKIPPKLPQPWKDTLGLTELSVDDKSMLAQHWEEVIGAYTSRESNKRSYIMYTDLLTV